MNKAYCSLIHGGLNVTTNRNSQIGFSPCCLMNDHKNDFVWLSKEEINVDPFKHPQLIDMRAENIQGTWRQGCAQCIYAERSTEKKSYRLGSNQKFGDIIGIEGPVNLYVFLDNSCNLACRTCSAENSSLWQKIEYDLGETNNKFNNKYDHDLVSKFFDGINLSNLKNIMFFGGEPLLGNSADRFLDYLSSRISLSDLQINFQTNGTFLPNARLLTALTQCRLIKMSISMDGIGEKFEYLRWPARWDKQVDNIMEFRRIAPTNLMFTVEQTLSPLNILYKDELIRFIEAGFNTNRLGDITDYNEHFALGIFALGNMTVEYVEHLRQIGMADYIPVDHVEDPVKIRYMLDTLVKHDRLRKQDWKTTFPDVVRFYERYL